MMQKRCMIKACFHILLLLLLVLVILPAHGQRMKGKVRSFRVTYYSVHQDFGKIRKHSRLDDPMHHDYDVFFDQNGNITHSVEYYPDGTIYCKCKGRDDYEDNKVESAYVRFYPEKEIDRKSFILKSVSFGLGRMCEMTYKNDSMGRPVEETIADPMGQVLFNSWIERDEKGNSTEELFSDGTVYRNKYDEDGNRIESIKAKGHDTTVTSFKYDKEGNIIEMNVNNFYKSTYKYRYDNFKYCYRYDDTGNWIERIEFDNDIPSRMAIRKITYSRK